MVRNDYVIVGYDLTELRDVLYTEEFAYNDENMEKWEYNQTSGNVQLFSDPCSGKHLYFGYILYANDEYSVESAKINICDLQKVKEVVDEKLKQIDWNMPREPIPYQLICFCEYH